MHSLVNRFAILHICLIAISNVMVQYPFEFFGVHTTLGAFVYPLIFVATDISARLFGSQLARKIIFISMFPGLILSFILANMFHEGHFVGLGHHMLQNTVAVRVAFASFIAYVTGQLLDILLFRHLRQHGRWWLAPGCASTLGTLFDTYVFCFLAFYQSQNPVLAEHWVEIANVDAMIKAVIAIVGVVPLYGVLLRLIGAKQPLSQTTLP